MAPDPMTRITVATFIVVNMLFKMLDSFTPTDSKSDSMMTTINEKKSGYDAKKSTLIGNKS